MADGSGKIENQAAGELASQACTQLALSIGIVLNSILVYVAPTQHFRALIALMQPGGAKVDIAAIRLLQEVPRTSTDAMMRRAIIVDWIVKVHMRYRLPTETFHLLVILIDRYISHRDVQPSHLNIVCFAAILIARQLNEVAHDEARFIQNAHNTDDILQMERSLVAGLQFNIAAPCEPHSLNQSISRQKCKRVAKTNAYPPPQRPHGGKHLRRAGTLAQPGGRQRGKDRRAPRKK